MYRLLINTLALPFLVDKSISLFLTPGEPTFRPLEALRLRRTMLRRCWTMLYEGGRCCTKVDDVDVRTTKGHLNERLAYDEG